MAVLALVQQRSVSLLHVLPRTVIGAISQQLFEHENVIIDGFFVTYEPVAFYYVSASQHYSLPIPWG